MPDVNIWLLAATGFVAGTFGAMLGIGGGILIIPILTLILGIPIQNAIGSSLVSIVINGLTAVSVYIRNHMTNLKLGLLLACTMVPGALAGAFMGSILSTTALSIIFAVLLLYVGYNLFPKKAKKLTTEELAIQKEEFENEHAPHAWLDDTYYDPALKEEIHYQVHRPVMGMFTGFFGGVLSSLLGVGGGIINVPVMSLIMKVPIKATIATSSLLLCFTTMTGSFVYAYNGFVLPHVIAPLTIGIYIGARFGASIAHRINAVLLMKIFTAILVLTAIIMVLKAMHVY
jgi:uncharacterized membrane protein YfcA